MQKCSYCSVLNKKKAGRCVACGAPLVKEMLVENATNVPNYNGMYLRANFGTQCFICPHCNTHFEKEVGEYIQILDDDLIEKTGFFDKLFSKYTAIPSWKIQTACTHCRAPINRWIPTGAPHYERTDPYGR